MLEQDPASGAKCSYKEKQFRQREEAILDATQEILSEKGFVGLCVEDITDRVGISKPTLYLHFASKEDVLVAIARRAVQYGISLIANLDHSLPPKERLRIFVDKCFESRFGEKGIRFGDAGFAASRMSKKWHEKQKDDEVLIGLLIGLVQEAEDAGQLHPGLHAPFAARYLLSILRDAGMEVLADAKVFSSQEMADAYMRMILR